jgi:hypothetical protein
MWWIRPGGEGKRFALGLGLIVSGDPNANDAGLVLAVNAVISVEQASRLMSTPLTEVYLGASGTQGAYNTPSTQDKYVNPSAFAARRWNISVVTS